MNMIIRVVNHKMLKQFDKQLIPPRKLGLVDPILRRGKDLSPLTRQSICGKK